MPRAARAIDNPVVTTKIIETQELPIGKTVRKRGKNSAVGTPVLVDVAERMPDPEKAAMLSFMEELVTIRPATSTDKNAEQIFEITVNGKTELFRRGEPKTVKRKFVELMARQKVTAYTAREVTNDQGDRQYVYDPVTAPKYDFAMLKDDNPMGESWLKSTLAMGG